MAVCGVVPVAAIVLVFPCIVRMQALLGGPLQYRVALVSLYLYHYFGRFSGSPEIFPLWEFRGKKMSNIQDD